MPSTALWKEQDLFLSFWFLQQWKDYGSGLGNVQYQFYPLVWHFRKTAWKATSEFLSLPCPYSPVLSTGTAGALSFQSFPYLGTINPRAFTLSTFSLVITIKQKFLLISFSQQSVSGLRLTDTFLKRTYEYDDIAQVCVVSSAVKVESWRKFPMLCFSLNFAEFSVFLSPLWNDQVYNKNKYLFYFLPKLKY